MKQPWYVLPQVMETLFSANAALHEALRDHLEDVAPSDYVRDYRTIRVNYGQRTGKTFYIAKTAEPEDLILCSGSALEYYLKDRTVRGRVADLNGTAVKQLKPDMYPRIWIEGDSWDTSRLLATWEQRSEFYDHIIHHHDQQVIIIG